MADAEVSLAADAGAAAAADRRQARRAAPSIDDSGLVEFEVGKALYGLITAGFVRRVGTSAARSVPKVNDTRVEEHRNLGVAFYKTGMLDEALREFRRVAELRPADASAPFYLGLIALRQARWAGRGRGVPAGGRQGRRPAGGAAQPRLRARAAGPAGRGGGRLRRCGEPGARRCPDHAGMGRRGAEAQRVRGGRQAGSRARASSWARRPVAGRSGTGPRAWRGRACELEEAAPDRDADGVAAYPAERRAAEQPRRAARADRRSGRARSSCCAAPCAEDPDAAADLQEPGRPALSRRPLRRGVRGLRARRQAGPRPGRRPLLQAGEHRVQAPRPGAGAGLLAAGRRSSIPATSWPAPTSRRWTPARDRRRRCGLRGAGAPDRRVEPGSTLECLQGQLPPAADRGADAGLRRAHLRRVPRVLDRTPRRDRAAARRAHDQRHPVLPQPGDLESGAATGAARAAGSPAGAGAGLERGLRLGRGAYTLAMVLAEALSTRRPGS